MNIDTKNLFLYFYIVAPALFYFFPLLVSYQTGEITLHFYTTHTFDFLNFLKIFAGHIILGLFIYFIFKCNFIIYFDKRSIVIDIIIVGLFIYLMFLQFSGIINMLVWVLFYILVARYRSYLLSYAILLTIALAQMVINEDRFAVVLILFLWGLPYIAKLSFIKLFFLSLIGVFILIFGLQPMRYGELPFSNINNISYIYSHLSPIYMTAGLASSIDFSITSLFFEFIPFAKSLSGDVGAVEKLAVEGLTQDLIYSGTRLGSNSAMYFSIIGIPILILMFLIIKSNMWILKSRMLINSYLMYFVLQGPYFIRRSFASYTIDIIVITILVIVISFIVFILTNQRKGDYEQ